MLDYWPFNKNLNMRLAQFIEENKKEIVEEWVDFAGENITSAKKLDLDEVKDHIYQMLEAICKDMRAPQSDAQQESKSKGNKEYFTGEANAAKEHGAQRVDVGFDIVELSSEFRALRASVLRLWNKERSKEDAEDEVEDIIRFNEAIDEAWMFSLERFHNKVDESKNWFLAVLGHDLRNPLAAISGVQHVLKLSKNLSKQERKLVTRTEASAKRMSELIKNLLELTNLRLGSGMTIHKTNTDIAKQAELIIQEFQFAYPEADFQLDSPGPVHGEWDTMRINQLMTNLVGNALRHGTPGGPITIKVSGDEDNAVFSVHNNGKPIPEEVQKSIFQGMFSRSKNNSSGESYGLGLYIVKEVVDRHKGNISLCSTEEHGTTFSVSLPRR